MGGSSAFRRRWRCRTGRTYRALRVGRIDLVGRWAWSAGEPGRPVGLVGR
ncbi:hypothetical protein ACIQMO_30690 [Streptomyces sp. NPDC091406]